MRRVWILVVIAACKGPAKESSTPAGDGAELPAALTAWLPKNADAAWHGAWVTRFAITRQGQKGSTQDPMALEIAGSKTRLYDGEHEVTFSYRFITPCAITLEEIGATGDPRTYDRPFVIANGTVEAGDGLAGYRHGKAAFVCTLLDHVYTFDDQGTCLEWTRIESSKISKDDPLGQHSPSTFRWDSKPQRCTWTKNEDGKDAFMIVDGDSKMLLAADGDVLRSDSFIRDSKSFEHAADYAAAKAKVDTLDAEHPVSLAGLRVAFGARAKALGGKPGDTSTLPGLFATYAADESLVGKPAKVVAYVEKWVKGDSVSVTVSNAADKDELPLECEAKADAPVDALTTGDKVRISGTVTASDRALVLADCTFEKTK